VTADGAQRTRAVAEVLELLSDCRLNDAIRLERSSPHRTTIENVLMALLVQHVPSDVLLAEAARHRASAESVDD
jgi:hypothetical protein